MANKNIEKTIKKPYKKRRILKKVQIINIFRISTDKRISGIMPTFYTTLFEPDKIPIFTDKFDIAILENENTLNI